MKIAFFTLWFLIILCNVIGMYYGIQKLIISMSIYNVCMIFLYYFGVKTDKK